MAREKLITRTIKGLNVTYISANIESNKMTEETVLIPYCKKESEIIERVKTMIEDEHIKFVTITGVEVTESKYGMAESAFLAEAKKLD